MKYLIFLLLIGCATNTKPKLKRDRVINIILERNSHGKWIARQVKRNVWKTKKDL